MPSPADPQPKADKSTKVIGILGFALALLPWGLSLMGVTVNLWLGIVVLGLAFALLAYAFWIWCDSWKWVRVPIVMIFASGLVFTGIRTVHVGKNSPKAKADLSATSAAKPSSPPAQSDQAPAPPQKGENAVASPAPFEIVANSTVPQYGPGSKIDGVAWKPYYSDLHFSIGNSTPNDYDDFDAEITTDLGIVDVKALRALGECHTESVHQTGEIHSQMKSGGVPIGPADDPAYDYEVMPFDKNGQQMLPAPGADWSYRIRCDKIPANSETDFFAVLRAPVKVTPTSAIGLEIPRAASWLTIKVEFTASGRKRKSVVSKCPMGDKPCSSHS